MTPTKQDFDNAVKQHWSTSTCILAQMHQRLYDEPLYDYDGKARPEFCLGKMNSVMENAMHTFDENFQHPGDENRPAMQQLRASLP